MTSYEIEAMGFAVEVDEEAARLIRLGVPAWEAVIQARQRVSKRRQDAKADQEA